MGKKSMASTLARFVFSQRSMHHHHDVGIDYYFEYGYWRCQKKQWEKRWKKKINRQKQQQHQWQGKNHLPITRWAAVFNAVGIGENLMQWKPYMANICSHIHTQARTFVHTFKSMHNIICVKVKDNAAPSCWRIVIEKSVWLVHCCPNWIRVGDIFDTFFGCVCLKERIEFTSPVTLIWFLCDEKIDKFHKLNRVDIWNDEFSIGNRRRKMYFCAYISIKFSQVRNLESQINHQTVFLLLLQ